MNLFRYAFASAAVGVQRNVNVNSDLNCVLVSIAVNASRFNDDWDKREIAFLLPEACGGLGFGFGFRCTRAVPFGLTETAPTGEYLLT